VGRSRPGGCNGVDTAGIYHGHDGVRAYWRRWFSAWESIQMGAVQIVDAGETIIVLIDGQRARGRGSGIALKAPPFAIGFTLQNRKIVRWVFYPNQAEALEAAGLSE
jgi:ketosteroid isomerase-like protein